MCVPSVFIREDGKGFVVREGGVDWAVGGSPELGFTAWDNETCTMAGIGDTILEAVNNALAKLRAASPRGDK